MKTITLEEHFFTESYLRAAKGDPSVQFGGLQSKLLDLGAGRIAAMDEAGLMCRCCRWRRLRWRG
jgi:hypothetical protein